MLGVCLGRAVVTVQLHITGDPRIVLQGDAATKLQEESSLKREAGQNRALPVSALAYFTPRILPCWYLSSPVSSASVSPRFSSHKINVAFPPPFFVLFIVACKGIGN